MVDDAKLARVFGEKALVVEVQAGYENVVANMLLAIAVPDAYPHLAVYYALSRAVGEGISQVEINAADQVPQAWLVAPKLGA